MAEIIKVLNRDQILDVVSLARVIWTDHYISIIGRKQVDYMLEKFQSEEAIAAQLDGGYEYYIVSQNAKNVGYMSLLPDAETDTAKLSKIYVLRAERGKGFGRLMLGFAENICRERRISTLWLNVNKNNTRSIGWYTRMGFKNVGAAVQDIGDGFAMDDYRMENKINC